MNQALDVWVPEGRDWVVSPWNREGVESSPLFQRRPMISDCTLRDGEQQPGVVFTADEKVEIARFLAGLGVRDLEVGTPTISADDRRAVESISHLGLKAEISAVARATEQDIDQVAECGVDSVRISFPIGGRQRDAKLHISEKEYIPRSLAIASYAKARGLRVIFSPFDTTRSRLHLLGELLGAFAREGCVDRVRMVDTVGAATPEAVAHLVRFMVAAGEGIPIEVHCHNDFGLAVANTLAGAIAGASYLSTTVNGIGERSGNAALEEVVMALKVLYGVELGIATEKLSQLSELIQQLSGVPLQAHKAIVGTNSFAHESGLVVAGILKDPFTAEAYAPHLVGQTRRIVLGKKSGAASIKHKLTESHVTPTDHLVHRVLALVKASATQSKRAVTDAEFNELLDQARITMDAEADR